MSVKKLYLVFSTVARIVEKPGDAATALGRRDSEMLFGEEFVAEREENGWLYGASAVDGYKGYVKKSDLKEKTTEPTHFTDTPWTHIYPAPSFKTPPVMGLSFLSRVAVDEKKAENGFVHVPDLGWIFAQHVKPLTAMKNADPVDTAMKLVDTPYIYGGRSAQGIDCSALVQSALIRNGQPCPRDSDVQQAALGKDVPVENAQRGDLVYFPGHVGIMVDNENLLNATARHMKVVVEPLKSVVAAGNKILAVKRL